MQKMMMALLLLSCGMDLSGCDTIPTSIDFSLPTPDKVCSDYPEEPTGDYTQKDVLIYAIDAKAAWLDCRSKAEALEKLVSRGSR